MKTIEMDDKETKEFVICSAIMLETGEIIYGHRHCHCFDVVRNRSGFTSERIYNSIQGFVTSTGRFVDRREAMSLQRAAGKKSAYSDDGELHGDILFSEDLY